MKIADICKKKKSLSFEIFPPKRTEDLENIDETLSVLCECDPDFISVTFGAGGSSNCNRTIELAKKIKNEYHVEPVVHLTCLHYNKSEIDEFARILTQEGIQNVLALRGDRNPDIPEKDDFKHASDLIRYLKPKSDFCFLGACYPECHPESDGKISEMKHLKAKVDAGAEVLLSQLFFDNDDFYRFVERCRIAGINVPIEAGIMPVLNKGSIERMVSMCGASMPRKLTRILARYGDHPQAMREAGMAYAIDQIADLIASGVDGVHLYTMNNSAVARQISDSVASIRTV